MTTARIVEAPKTGPALVVPPAALFPSRVSPAPTLITAGALTVVERIVEVAIPVKTISTSAAAGTIFIRIEAARTTRKAPVAPIPVIAIEDAAGVRIGIEPDHPAFGCHPFDPVVLAAIGTEKGPLGVIKGAGVAFADLRQNPVK